MKYIKLFEDYNDLVYFELADGKITQQYYDTVCDEDYGIDEEDFNNYLSVLKDYYYNGGEIQRIIFSYSKPRKNTKTIGYSWTHINNDWKNYLQSIYDFNMEEGKINGDEGIYLVKAITQPKNITINGSLEQYELNRDEEELTLIDTTKIKILSIEQVGGL